MTDDYLIVKKAIESTDGIDALSDKEYARYSALKNDLPTPVRKAVAGGIDALSDEEYSQYGEWKTWSTGDNELVIEQAPAPTAASPTRDIGLRVGGVNLPAPAEVRAPGKPTGPEAVVLDRKGMLAQLARRMPGGVIPEPKKLALMSQKLTPSQGLETVRAALALQSDVDDATLSEMMSNNSAFGSAKRVAQQESKFAKQSKDLPNLTLTSKEIFLPDWSAAVRADRGKFVSAVALLQDLTKQPANVISSLVAELAEQAGNKGVARADLLQRLAQKNIDRGAAEQFLSTVLDPSFLYGGKAAKGILMKGAEAGRAGRLGVVGEGAEKAQGMLYGKAEEVTHAVPIAGLREADRTAAVLNAPTEAARRAAYSAPGKVLASETIGSRVARDLFEQMPMNAKDIAYTATVDSENGGAGPALALATGIVLGNVVARAGGRGVEKLNGSVPTEEALYGKLASGVGEGKPEAVLQELRKRGFTDKDFQMRAVSGRAALAKDVVKADIKAASDIVDALLKDNSVDVTTVIDELGRAAQEYAKLPDEGAQVIARRLNRARTLLMGKSRKTSTVFEVPTEATAKAGAATDVALPGAKAGPTAGLVAEPKTTARYELPLDQVRKMTQILGKRAEGVATAVNDKLATGEIRRTYRELLDNPKFIAEGTITPEQMKTVTAEYARMREGFKALDVLRDFVKDGSSQYGIAKGGAAAERSVREANRAGMVGKAMEMLKAQEYAKKVLAKAKQSDSKLLAEQVAFFDNEIMEWAAEASAKNKVFAERQANAIAEKASGKSFKDKLGDAIEMALRVASAPVRHPAYGAARKAATRPGQAVGAVDQLSGAESLEGSDGPGLIDKAENEISRKWDSAKTGVTKGLEKAKAGVMDAIFGAEQKLGNPELAPVFRAIVAQESRGDPNAKNPKSSATGLTQFINDTWNGLVGEKRRVGYLWDALSEESKATIDSLGLEARKDANVAAEVSAIQLDYLGRKYRDDKDKVIAAWFLGEPDVNKAVKQAQVKGGEWTDYITADAKTYLDSVKARIPGGEQ